MTKTQLIKRLTNRQDEKVSIYHSTQDCLDEMVYDTKLNEVAELKDEGIEQQVDYLLSKGFGVQDIAEATGLAPVD